MQFSVGVHKSHIHHRNVRMVNERKQRVDNKTFVFVQMRSNSI